MSPNSFDNMNEFHNISEMSIGTNGFKRAEDSVGHDRVIELTGVLI